MTATEGPPMFAIILFIIAQFTQAHPVPSAHVVHPAIHHVAAPVTRAPHRTWHSTPPPTNTAACRSIATQLWSEPFAHGDFYPGDPLVIRFNRLHCNPALLQPGGLS